MSTTGRPRRASDSTEAEGLTPLERAVFDELNFARTQPKELAKHIAATMKNFDGKLMHRPGRASLRTQEGVAAVDEAIKYLERAAPRPAFTRVSAGMSRAARDHVDDTGRRGSTGHAGTDGSAPQDRLERHGSWRRSSGENISYGFAADAREVVVQLIVDDGVPDRGHRTNIFKPEFNVVGIASGPHATWEFMCVVTFAGDYEEEGGAAVSKVRMPTDGAVVDRGSRGSGGGGSGGGIEPRMRALSVGGAPAAAGGGGRARASSDAKPPSQAERLKSSALAAGPPAKKASDAVPPGGKREVQVKTQVSTSGGKKTTVTTTTTVTTDAKGNTSTRVETNTKIETVR